MIENISLLNCRQADNFFAVRQKENGKKETFTYSKT